MVSQALAASRGPLPPETLRIIFRELMSGSRSLQRTIHVACLGPKYSYSHLAAVAKFGEAVEHVPVGSIAAVFEEVNRRHVEFGLVPLENSTDGRVADTLDMFVKLPNIKIRAEVRLRIHHCLLGRCEWGQVRRVYSKSQALSQCRNWLGKNLPQATKVEVVSTAAAAELAQREEFAAAVASRAAASPTGLNVLAENIEDQPHNVTRFAVIGDRAEERTGRDKTALMIRLPNQAGSLARTISPFEKFGVNMTWIESFPIPGPIVKGDDTNPSYLFFIDVEGHQNDPAVRQAIETVRKAMRTDRHHRVLSAQRVHRILTPAGCGMAEKGKIHGRPAVVMGGYRRSHSDGRGATRAGSVIERHGLVRPGPERPVVEQGERSLPPEITEAGALRGGPDPGRSPPAANDWNPHYLQGKAYFVQGNYDDALTELEQNVAECDGIDFESMSRQNAYFDHISNSIPRMGQNPHEFIRASNLQWVAAVMAAQGRYDPAETRFFEMANYGEKCWPGRLSTYEGCACQGLAFLLAARGRYAQAADRYRFALAQIEGNEVQIGLPPAPCVAMILVALADVELARGRAGAAEQCIRRAEHVQEAEHQLGMGPAPLDRAALLTVSAQLRQCQLRYSEGYDLYTEALRLIQNIRQEHPLTGYCLEGLGEIDLARGRLDESAEHFRESYDVRRSALGESHRQVAYSLDGLARVAVAKGNHEEAESLFKDATTILTRALGPAHPDVIAIAEHQKRNDDHRARPNDDATKHSVRFLAIPTFLTLGWQVLHIGKDWRIVEGNIRRREAKEAKAARRAMVSAQAATAGRNGR